MLVGNKLKICVGAGFEISSTLVIQPILINLPIGWIQINVSLGSRVGKVSGICHHGRPHIWIGKFMSKIFIIVIVLIIIIDAGMICTIVSHSRMIRNLKQSGNGTGGCSLRFVFFWGGFSLNSYFGKEFFTMSSS